MVKRTRGAWSWLALGCCLLWASGTAGCSDGDDDDAVTKTAAPPQALPGGPPVLPAPPGTVPAVTGISPASGISAGGTTSQISGINFVAGATVLVGSAAATVLNASATTLTVRLPAAPPGATGPLPVSVTNPAGPSGSLTQAYTYLASQVAAGPGGVQAIDGDIDENGVIHVVWQAVPANGDVETHYVRSTDDGRSWVDARLLQRTANPASRPRIGAGGGSVMVVWNEQVAGTHQVSSARSTDAGVTWSGAAAYIGAPGVRPDADIDVDGNGLAVVAHLASGGATAAGNARVQVRAVSGTVGSAPASPVAVTSGDVLASHPCVAADGNGLVIVAWLAEGADGGTARDCWLTNSIDGGATYLTPLQITQAGPSGRTPAAPRVDLRGSRALLAFLQNGLDTAGNPVTDVMAAISADAGRTWPGGGPVVGGLAGSARYTPVAAVSGNGDLHLAWQESIVVAPGGGSGAGFEIRSARSPDAGQTWGVVNRSGTAASSILPAVAGGAGNRVVHLWAEGTAVKSY